MTLLALVDHEFVEAQERGTHASNTFHWTTEDPFVIADVLQAHVDMWTVAPPNETVPLGSYLSVALSRGANASRVRLYDLDQPEPRLPIGEQFFTLPTEFTTPRLPAEVAAVVSIRATPIAGINPQRLRGRKYLGPLVEPAVDDTTGLLDAGFMDVAAEALAVFRDSPPTNCLWVIHSVEARDNSDHNIPYEDRPLLPPIDSAVVEVEIDNAPDTQRRRGRAATTSVSR